MYIRAHCVDFTIYKIYYYYYYYYYYDIIVRDNVMLGKISGDGFCTVMENKTQRLIIYQGGYETKQNTLCMYVWA